jgi:hypothetical protein
MADILHSESSRPVEAPSLAQTAAVPPDSASSPSPPRTQSELGPIDEEIVEEWRWIMEARQRGDFDSYRGQHVAVYRQKIWGSSYDPELLREYIALKYQIDPERLVVVYIDRW